MVHECSILFYGISTKAQSVRNGLTMAVNTPKVVFFSLYIELDCYYFDKQY